MSGNETTPTDAEKLAEAKKLVAWMFRKVQAEIEDQGRRKDNMAYYFGDYCTGATHLVKATHLLFGIPVDEICEMLELDRDTLGLDDVPGGAS